jgi:hypothetical protein
MAEARGLSVTDVTRFLRCAIARHVFKEPRKGIIVHTAASKLLLNNPMVEHWILNVAQEFWPSVTRMVDATEKWPGSEEPNESVSLNVYLTIRGSSSFHRGTLFPTIPTKTRLMLSRRIQSDSNSLLML